MREPANLRDAIDRTITYDDPESGKHYELNEDLTSLATIIARPRGWHLFEKHMLVDGKQVPAGIFDFGLYFFHNVRTLLDAAPVRTSTCPRWRPAKRRGFGTTSS